jgi:hypothetical protein
LKAVAPAAVDAPTMGEDEDGELRSWAIQFRPSDLEVELWNAKKVKIYDVDINEFVRCLRQQET